MTGKPFAYLEGMVAADDAPLMDNPARLYCPQCRAEDRLVCDDPGFCGNMRPMKPIPDTEAPPLAAAPAKTAKPKSNPPILLDQSRAQESLQRRQESPERPRSRPQAGEVFPERLMGRKTTITQLPDAEQDWDWFMENLDPEKWK